MTNFSVVDDTFDPGVTSSYFLSIQISLDGFSFCTLDPVRNKYIQFQHIQFDKSLPLSQQVEESFLRNEKLNLPYKKTLVLMPTNKSTLVPSALFEQSKKEQWLKFCHQIPEDHLVFYNKIKMADAYNVFAVPNAIHELLIRQFLDPLFFHQYTPVIESNLAINISGREKTLLFINLANNYFDLFAFKNNNLKLCNSYSIKTENDFIYFTLFVFEQLKLQPADTEILISGYHTNGEEMIRHLRRYIRKVKQVSIPHHFQYSHMFREINNQPFYNLLSLPVCV
ncbi:DUF3822 family protein [Alkalitalea saponilacus]|uniref:DUF3822 domain-containing protein n=1 Tax=Alkalitalea saponilacus TaxID=889453 RepID=A0A1T5H9P8_9BACT|nr:DUF3822 family protein [Alkalitalea saponilacus]SKC17289.1 Protein of unknown function [Alkalitalea saponilacus]